MISIRNCEIRGLARAAMNIAVLAPWSPAPTRATSSTRKRRAASMPARSTILPTRSCCERRDRRLRMRLRAVHHRRWTHRGRAHRRPASAKPAGTTIVARYSRDRSRTRPVQCNNTQSPGLYTPLSVARFQGDQALKRLQGWTDAQVANRQSLIAQAATYAGYSLEFLGEAMCSAAIDLGPEMTRAQLLHAAQDRFTTAITAAQASSNTAMLNAARLGRARSLVDAGNLAQARADAALVPDRFVLNASYSSAVAGARTSSIRRCIAASSRRSIRASGT